MVSPPAPDAKFIVLKYLQRNAETMVWLAMISNTSLSGTVCAVKQVYDLADATREAALWATSTKSRR